MVPRCRCQYRGGTHTGNIKLVQRGRHDAWHHLFGTMMPHEVIAYIVAKLVEPGYFREVELTARWEDAEYSFDLRGSKCDEPYLAVPRIFERTDWDKVFGAATTFSAAVQVVREWAPPGYFAFVNIVTSAGERYRFSTEDDALAA